MYKNHIIQKGSNSFVTCKQRWATYSVKYYENLVANIS